jgi:hypothetical protein
VVAKRVIMMPTSHITPVLVTFKRDRVKASNILVILTPPKLYTAMVRIPEMTKNIRNPF